MACRPEVISPAERLSTRQGDVFDASSMVKAIAGTEAVISCIGPPSNLSPDTAKKGLLNNFMAAKNVMATNFSPGTVMSEGIPNILAACQRAGDKRLVMQSGINLSDGKELSAVNRWAVGLMRRIYWKAIDKAIAEHAVIRSDLDWVIVRASVLKYADGTLKYTARSISSHLSTPAAALCILCRLPCAGDE
ncbi:SDR family oxidoreductase [Paenibacillus dokdonensis]|uniref:SDR family oxidoreductase n=1 Tax=Paenibacillus dokdonensis TaxID=2567944 RepID=A0ABU6GW84_9BACL|nr:NAD(P)-binding oxidoreductase [Paenibacillus dokdonensis]MEC0243614.1 SDR family oxidoreductase [Paenibacillus dokdonensis]